MHQVTRNRVVIMAVLVVLALLATMTLTAQPSAVTRPVESVMPEGEIMDTTPVFAFRYNPAPAAEIAYFNVVVNDGTVELLNEWFEIAEVCAEGEIQGALDCFADPDSVLFDGVGDKALTWTLSEYNATTQEITLVDTYDFTIVAPVIAGPATFSEPNGSPQFSFVVLGNLSPGILAGQVAVVDADNNLVAFEWVEVGDNVICAGGTCEIPLQEIAAPLYASGTYTAYIRAAGEGTGGDVSFSLWSEGFTVTTDYVEPQDPTVFLERLGNQPEMIDAFSGVTYSLGDSCQQPVEPGAPFACSNSDVSAIFVVEDHGQTALQARGSQEYYPIFNATEWFNVTITDDNNADAIVFSEWINSYTSEQCVNSYGIDSAERAIAGGGQCLVNFPLLASGEYTLTYASYNPGGTPSASTGLTITTTGPGLDLMSDGPDDPISAVFVEANDVSVDLYWDDEAFVPEWVNFIVRDALNPGQPLLDVWVSVRTAFEIDQSFNQLETGAISSYYAAVGDILLCNRGECSADLLWQPLQNGDYAMTVRTWAGGDVSDESAPIAFSIDNLPPVVDEQSIDTEFNFLRNFEVRGDALPTLYWSVNNNAGWHNVVIEDAQGNELVNSWFRHLDGCFATGGGTFSCRYNAGLVLGSGTYTFRIRGWSTGGMGEFTADQTLTISRDPLSVPTPINPNLLDGPYESNPIFGVEQVENASYYEIRVTPDGGNTPVYQQWFYYPADECTDDATVICNIAPGPSFELLDGDYTWAVRAANGSDFTNWSAEQAFNVATETTNSGVQPIWPDFFEVTGEVDIFWEADPANDWYGLNLWRFDADGEESIIPSIQSVAELGTPTLTEWRNEGDLGEACGRVITGRARAAMHAAMNVQRDNPLLSLLPPAYCVLTIPAGVLEPGIYVWTVDSWGPTYGNTFKVSEDATLFIYR